MAAFTLRLYASLFALTVFGQLVAAELPDLLEGGQNVCNETRYRFVKGGRQFSWRVVKYETNQAFEVQVCCKGWSQGLQEEDCSVPAPSNTSTISPTTGTAEPSTTATADPSTTATAEPSTTATAEPSTTATAEPSTTATAEQSRPTLKLMTAIFKERNDGSDGMEIGVIVGASIASACLLILLVALVIFLAKSRRSNKSQA